MGRRKEEKEASLASLGRRITLRIEASPLPRVRDNSAQRGLSFSLFIPVSTVGQRSLFFSVIPVSLLGREASTLLYSRFTVGREASTPLFPFHCWAEIGLPLLFPLHCWARKRPPWTLSRPLLLLMSLMSVMLLPSVLFS